MSFSRIVAHTDFDGLIAAFLIRDMFGVEDIVFTDPWLIQKKEFDIKKGDVIVDLPYDERCSLWIDHHKSNEEDADILRKEKPEKVVFDSSEPSCPGLIYTHYKEDFPFLKEPLMQEMIRAANKIDSASFTREDLENPDVWGCLSMTLRSDDKKKDDEYKLLLLNLLSFQDPKKILEQSLVKKRLDEVLLLRERARNVLEEHAYVDEKHPVVILDLVDVDEKVPRFEPYLMFPKAAVSITIKDIRDEPSRLKVSVGKNIFYENETNFDIGAIMKEYGGGGHAVVGGCSILRSEKEAFLSDVIDKLFK